MDKNEYQIWQDCMKEIRDLKRLQTDLAQRIQDHAKENLVLGGVSSDIEKKIYDLYEKVISYLDGEETDEGNNSRQTGSIRG